MKIRNLSSTLCKGYSDYISRLMMGCVELDFFPAYFCAMLWKICGEILPKLCNNTISLASEMTLGVSEWEIALQIDKEMLKCPPMHLN